jgi:hypothetical protein
MRRILDLIDHLLDYQHFHHHGGCREGVACQQMQMQDSLADVLVSQRDPKSHGNGPAQYCPSKKKAPAVCWGLKGESHHFRGRNDVW